MILDETLEFCDAEAVFGAAGTAVGGDVVDLSAAAVNPGRGQPVYLVLEVTTAFTTAIAAEVEFRLASDSTADLATSPTTHWSSTALDTGVLTAGKRFIVALPQGVDYERYLGINVVTTTNATTAGAINAFLTLDVDNWHPYPDAQN